MRFTAVNRIWQVQTAAGFIYNYTTGVDGEVLDGTTTDFGWLQPGVPDQMRAAAAFAATQVTWNNIPGACWDVNGPGRGVSFAARHRWLNGRATDIGGGDERDTGWVSPPFGPCRTGQRSSRGC